MVSMMALSGVGVAASVGAFCDTALELNIADDANIASALNKTFPRRIAISFFCDLDCDRRR
jgi:hypothetical protein